MSTPNSSGFFPLSQRRRLMAEVRLGEYSRKIAPDALVLAFMTAFARRLSGLREVTHWLGGALGTSNFSSLSHAPARESSLRYVQRLLAMLEPRGQGRDGELVAIDGMAVTLPATQRHRCKKYNRRTVGGGVIWSFAIRARLGQCPVRVLKVVEGAWRDGTRMAGVALQKGPVYLMDRGFYTLALVALWLEQDVRFIVRARHDATGEVLNNLSRPRRYRNGRIELDARVRLGSSGLRDHPEARMIRAVIGRQTLVLVTSELEWSAERVLDAYRQRERIEQFHRILKETIGLAHLYSFAQNGLAFLLHVALLLAILVSLKTSEASYFQTGGGPVFQAQSPVTSAEKLDPEGSDNDDSYRGRRLPNSHSGLAVLFPFTADFLADFHAFHR